MTMFLTSMIGFMLRIIFLGVVKNLYYCWLSEVHRVRPGIVFAFLLLCSMPTGPSWYQTHVLGISDCTLF